MRSHKERAVKVLELKVGARVMLLRNENVEKGLYNGKFAFVRRIEGDWIILEDADDRSRIFPLSKNVFKLEHCGHY